MGFLNTVHIRSTSSADSRRREGGQNNRGGIGKRNLVATHPMRLHCLVAIVQIRGRAMPIARQVVCCAIDHGRDWVGGFLFFNCI